jgi:hypothetical protein
VSATHFRSCVHLPGMSMTGGGECDRGVSHGAGPPTQHAAMLAFMPRRLVFVRVSNRERHAGAGRVGCGFCPCVLCT